MKKTCKGHWWLFFWGLATWFGLIIGALITFILWSSLQLNRYSHEDLGYVLRGVMLCGAVQGGVLAILQGFVLQTLVSSNLKKVGQWCLVTVFAMPVGCALSIAMGQLNPPFDIDNASIVGTVLSWSLTGLLLGAMVGHHQQQKIQLAVVNAGAYTIWGMAQVFFIFIFGAILDYVPINLMGWILIGLVFTLMLVAGLWLNRVVLLRSRFFVKLCI